jgi:integrase
LRWKDLELDAGTLQVRQILALVQTHDSAMGALRTRLLFQEPTTAAARRTVLLPPACLAALKRHRTRQAEEKLKLGAAYQEPWADRVQGRR